jgi:hypothetical protein
LNCTPTAPLFAVAFTIVMLATVAPAVGAVMETVRGGGGSGGAADAVVTVKSDDTAKFAAASLDFTR